MAAEPGTTEPGVTVTEAHSGSTYKAEISTEKSDQTQVTPSHTETTPEASNNIHMPAATRGILRNPLSQITQRQNTPPRTFITVKSIGRGGLFDGSRIAVDDFSADSLIVSTADTETTLVASDSLSEVRTMVDQDADVECERQGHGQRSGATSAHDESTEPRVKMDLMKDKKSKKGVSFDDVPFVIGSDIEHDDDETDSSSVLSDVTPFIPSALPPVITLPKTFEIVEEEADEPALVPSNPSTEAIQGSPITSRAQPVFSEVMSPRPTADELSDSSAVLAAGQFPAKQVEDSSHAHRGKALPTIHVVCDHMEACSDIELAGRLRSGSRTASTEMIKVLVGDNMKGVGANGLISLPPPPVRRASYGWRR